MLILALSVLFLSHHPPLWIVGAAMGAGAAVPAVALRTAAQLSLPSRRRLHHRRFPAARWALYAAAGALGAALFPSSMVLVILLSGLVEAAFARRANPTREQMVLWAPSAFAHAGALGGVGALAWVALKVGALSYGGGFVIIPLMQHDVVSSYHWMTGAQFLDAVGLGQVTPGPVVLTVAAVGYAARGLFGALLGATIAFAPSFLFVLLGAPRFDRLRTNATAAGFLAGAGPCVIGAIAGSSIALCLLLQRSWQVPIVVGAALWLFIARKSALSALLLGGVAGVIVVLVRSHT